MFRKLAIAAALSFIGVFLQVSMFGFSAAGTLSAGALVFALSALIIGVNLLIDLAYGLIDPRIRTQ